MKNLQIISKGLLIFALFSFGKTAFSQAFEQYFENKTLRLDYIFGGNKERQFILLDELASYPEWSGRKNHLTELPLKGNGQVCVLDDSTGEVIYTNSFSTLFQEWLSTEEANYVKKSFENVCLVPFPKQKVKIEVTLFDKNGEEGLVFTHTVDPLDILIHQKGTQIESEYVFIHKAKEGVKAINVVFVAEGYQEQEMDKFMKSAKISVEEIFKHAPFGKFKDHFNFIAVKSISKDSGVSVPRTGEWKNTAINSHFDTFYSERYLTTPRIKKMHDILAGIPYEHIIVLANTDVYGGGGIYNSYTLTTTGNAQFKPVVVHEFGHSFAGLGDEYFYEGGVLNEFISSETEPWEQNITTLIDFDSKWKHLLKEKTPIPTEREQVKKYPIGVYQVLPNVSIFVSELDCRMKTNQAESFCNVCQKAIERLVRFYTD